MSVLHFAVSIIIIVIVIIVIIFFLVNYILEYLLLQSPPSTYHRESLVDGQIWLRLSPLTTEDSVVVAGYKIICSTDVSLTPPTSCYNGLVPANTRDVLLSLPDVTRTFYAAVQIVRNFNGQELTEDKYSEVGPAFCAGKKQFDCQ